MTEQKLPLMMFRGALDSDEHIRAFRKSEYMSRWLLAASILNEDVLYKSPVHGLGHIERVMLLGALIAGAEKLNGRATQLLLFACSYHDIGRVDDSRDELHGRRSAEMITEKGLTGVFPHLTEQELLILKTAICSHSMHDSAVPCNAARYGVLSRFSGLCDDISYFLKDADNLDRVRLGDLDAKHLRHLSARRLVPTAQFIFDKYNEY